MSVFLLNLCMHNHESFHIEFPQGHDPFPMLLLYIETQTGNFDIPHRLSFIKIL